LIRKLGVGLFVAAALLLSPDAGVEASSFSPSVAVSLANPAPGANSSITTTVALPLQDAMFETVVMFTPPEFGIADGDTVSDGAVVGTMNQDMVLGLIGSSCNQLLEPEWDLLDGSTNIADTVSYEDVDDDGDPDFFEDENGDDLLDSVTKYPEPLTRIFPGVTPRARIVGLTPIAGVPFLVNFVTFEPGTDLLGYTFHPSLGYPTAVVFLDNGDIQSVQEPGAISDWCSPLNMEVVVQGITVNNPGTAADEGGESYRTNPAVSGTYGFTTFAVSLPDADDDGYENPLDTCPFSDNVGNPRVVAAGDQDNDGLDAACDPNDNPATGGTNSDQDGDGYLNRQDNCPLVQNGQSDLMNQSDTDLDGIGDSCDIDPNVTSGHRHAHCEVDGVAVGAGGPLVPPLLPCDSDGDGVDDTADNCPTIANAAGQTADTDGDIAGDACDGPGSGNVDCSGPSGGVSSVDALKVLRFGAALSVVQSEPCLDLGMPRALAPPENWNMGDVNCSAVVNAVDALLILRAVAGLPWLIPPPGCPPIIGQPEPAPVAQSVLKADGDDADSEFEEPELTTSGSTVTYRMAIDNDSPFAATITSVLDDVDSVNCVDGENKNAVGEILSPDDGDGGTFSDTGPDTLVCMFQKSVSGPSATQINTLVTVGLQGQGPPGGTSDLTVVIIE
jgi:hypothetical protein